MENLQVSALKNHIRTLRNLKFEWYLIHFPYKLVQITIWVHTFQKTDIASETLQSRLCPLYFAITTIQIFIKKLIMNLVVTIMQIVIDETTTRDGERYLIKMNDEKFKIGKDFWLYFSS